MTLKVNILAWVGTIERASYEVFDSRIPCSFPRSPLCRSGTRPAKISRFSKRRLYSHHEGDERPLPIAEQIRERHLLDHRRMHRPGDVRVSAFTLPFERQSRRPA